MNLLTNKQLTNKQLTIEHMKKKVKILFLLLISRLSVMGQTISASNNKLSFLEQPLAYKTIAFSVQGRVYFPNKNSWLLVIKDTTKLNIKYADSIFILHISPRFVRKLNDSTYTFQNK